MKNINLRLEEELLEKIDQKRGLVPRSIWIRDALRKASGAPPPKKVEPPKREPKEQPKPPEEDSPEPKVLPRVPRVQKGSEISMPALCVCGHPRLRHPSGRTCVKCHCQKFRPADLPLG